VPSEDPSWDAAVAALAAQIRAHLADSANRRAVVDLVIGDGPEDRRLRRQAEVQAELPGIRYEVRWEDLGA
jgi:hypothetical protein